MLAICLQSLQQQLCIRKGSILHFQTIFFNLLKDAHDLILSKPIYRIICKENSTISRHSYGMVFKSNPSPTMFSQSPRTRRNRFPRKQACTLITDKREVQRAEVNKEVKEPHIPLRQMHFVLFWHLDYGSAFSRHV